MATKAHVPFAGREKAMVDYLLANIAVLNESAQDIVRDIDARKPLTLSAKQVKMLAEMKDRAEATVRAQKLAAAK